MTDAEQSVSRKILAKVMKGEGPCVKANGVAVSRQIAEALGLKVGSPVLVTGSRTTIAVVESIENIRDPIIYLGRVTRMNSEAHWNEYVELSNVTSREKAEKVVVGPSEEGQILDIEVDALKGLLIGTYVTAGDTVEVGARGFHNILRARSDSRYIRLCVIETVPKGFVQISAETEIQVSRHFREVRVKRPSVTYDDIGGHREVIEKVREMVELPLRNPDLFIHLGIEPPKGVLMHGPPGTGKTLLAKAVANESRAYFIYVGASYFPIHESERRLKEIFAEAAQHAPSIIFIDEIDVIAPKREGVLDPAERRFIGALLELMDGMKDRGKVIVMAATNRVNDIDPALRRPGRFDREIEVPLPDEDGRLEILKIHTRYMPLDKDVDLRKIAESTPGYSGADIRLLCQEAALNCVKRFKSKFNPDGTIPEDVLKKMLVTMQDFIEGTKKITPSCGREFIAEIPKVRWDDVGGYRELKSKIMELVIIPWKYSKDARKYGVKSPKGILLYGPPGTGKTYLAKAIANEVGVKVITARGSTLKSMWFGEYERNIAKLFEAARKSAPVIIILDEAESVVGRRTGMVGGASRALDSGVNEFLTQLDGVQEIHDVLLICTTNRPDMLDEAFLRSGRVGYHFALPLPDREARIEIFRVHLKNLKIPLGDDVDVEVLADLTEGLAGADIKEVVESAARKWFRDHITGKSHDDGGPEKLKMAYFTEAIEELKFSTINGRSGEVEALLL
jgi:transitional endoplasmic reticulum ATPase